MPEEQNKNQEENTVPVAPIQAEEQFTHKCIKISCPNTYQDNDEDSYYCPSCVEENKVIAAKVDQIIASKPRKETKSALQLYDEAAKMRGNKGFVRPEDIGLRI